MKNDKSLNTIIILTVTLVSCALLLTFLFPVFFISGKFETFGNYGGFIGGLLGSILSFITVILVYKTYRLQEEELRETRRQLRKQQFETVFFNMLGMIHTLGKEFDPIRDKNFFVEFMNELKLNYDPINKVSITTGESYNNTLVEVSVKNNLMFHNENETQPTIMNITSNARQQFNLWRASTMENEQEYIGQLYLKFFTKHNYQLGHFFSYINNTIKYVIKERKDIGDEKEYIDLIQSQLSIYQLAVMFYNSISAKSLKSKEIPRFKDLLDKYQFFENLPSDVLIVPTDQRFYPKTNFKYAYNKLAVENEEEEK